MDKIDSWVLNRGGVTYDCEELSVLDLVGKTAVKTNEVVDKVTILEDSNNKKVSHDEMNSIYKHEGSDFKGSWHGIEKPQFAEPGIAGVVDNLVSQLDEIMNNHLEVSIGDYSNLVVNEDWTNAIKEAIKILNERFSNENKGVGTLLIPRGIFKYTETINLPYGCKLKGVSKDASILMPVMTNGYAINTNKYTTIEDLTIDGSLSSGDAININNPIRKSTYNNIAIIEFRSGTALTLNSAYCTTFNWIEVLRCKRVAYFSTEHNNNISFFACDFVDIFGQYAFEIEHCVSLSFYSCTWGKVYIQENGSYNGCCIHMKTGSGLYVNSNWFEWCLNSLISEQGENIDIINSHIASGIMLNGGTNVNIERCDFYGNGGRITANNVSNIKSLMNRNVQGYSLHYGESSIETQSITHNDLDRGVQIPKGKEFKVKDGLSITQYASGGGLGNVDIDLQQLSGNNTVSMKNSKGRINKFLLDTGDFLTYESGRGYACKTPDGTKLYRIWVDNDGSIKTSLIT